VGGWSAVGSVPGSSAMGQLETFRKALMRGGLFMGHAPITHS